MRNMMALGHMQSGTHMSRCAAHRLKSAPVAAALRAAKSVSAARSAQPTLTCHMPASLRQAPAPRRMAATGRPSVAVAAAPPSDVFVLDFDGMRVLLLVHPGCYSAPH